MLEAAEYSPPVWITNLHAMRFTVCGNAAATTSARVWISTLNIATIYTLVRRAGVALELPLPSET